jgi:hypothetical protein
MLYKKFNGFQGVVAGMLAGLALFTTFFCRQNTSS